MTRGPKYGPAGKRPKKPGIILASPGLPVRRPGGSDPPKNKAQVWCYVCNAAHAYHGRTETNGKVKEALDA